MQTSTCWDRRSCTSLYCADRTCGTAFACLRASALQEGRKTLHVLGTWYMFCEQAWDSQSYLQKFLLQGQKHAVSVFPHFLLRTLEAYPRDLSASAMELCCGMGKLAVPCEAVTLAHRHILMGVFLSLACSNPCFRSSLAARTCR